MDWDDLRYLLAVQRTGSFAAAARLLRVDQTTIGRRLDALETQLGARLVERSSAGCQMTPAGLRACAAGSAMEAAAQTLDLEIAGHDLGIEGLVRIAVPLGFLPVVAPLLAALSQRHPLLRFDLDTAPGLHNLAQREADLALRMTPDSQPSLLTTRLGHIAWGLYAAESYLARRGMPETLAGHDIVGYLEPLTRTPGGRWLAEHGTEARTVARVDNMLAAVVAAAAGIGLVAAPCFIAEREPALRRAWPEAIAQSGIYLVTLADLARVPRVRATMDHLAAGIRGVVGFRALVG